MIVVAVIICSRDKFSVLVVGPRLVKMVIGSSRVQSYLINAIVSSIMSSDAHGSIPFKWRAAMECSSSFNCADDGRCEAMWSDEIQCRIIFLFCLVGEVNGLLRSTRLRRLTSLKSQIDVLILSAKWLTSVRLETKSSRIS